VLELDKVEAELAAKKLGRVSIKAGEAYLHFPDGTHLWLEGAQWGSDSRFTPGGALFTRVLMLAGEMTSGEAQEISLTLPTDYTGDVVVKRNGRFQ